MRICFGTVCLAILCRYADSMASGTTALMAYPAEPLKERPPTGVVVRAKRQFGGFGCCPMMPPICCPMPLMIPIPPPIPPPIFMPSCCGCCLPVCMPMCVAGGCGCGGLGMFGRRKRSAIIERNPVALRLTWSH
ncbi:hypothetical protein GCK32_010844 [Trichostrongylus colubriformis]|uniref:Uncharacterized protein n=1 Tax=Trichostrongylus colubriformis TaxID=6319 RepID=A0AAN8IEV5_TRICO